MAGLRKILLVEDDPQITEIYMSVLNYYHYEAVSAANYDEALKQAKTFQPDLIFLDIMIPGRSGLDVLHTLRNDPQFMSQKKKIVLLTNLGENHQIKEVLDKNQADGYVIKANISAEDLHEIIQSLDTTVQDEQSKAPSV